MYGQIKKCLKVWSLENCQQILQKQSCKSPLKLAKFSYGNLDDHGYINSAFNTDKEYI